MGMAPTSVLEPMVLLYRLTGEPRYLDFCKYILRAWEQPNGPKDHLHAAHRQTRGQGRQRQSLRDALLPQRRAGILPHRRRPQILQACLNAWQDIVDHRLYITGAASYREIFHDDYDLPNVNNVGETCVTVTWLQFNAQLLRLTGEARFAEQLEHVVLNQLFGAERCDGSAWGYYVQMEGKKPYSSTLDGHCCLSSGPRGVALIPTFALPPMPTAWWSIFTKQAPPNSSSATARRSPSPRRRKYPSDGRIRITVTPDGEEILRRQSCAFPPGAKNPVVQVNGRAINANRRARRLRRPAAGMEERGPDPTRVQAGAAVIIGDHKNEGKIAVLYGPLVLAADEALLGNAGLPAERGRRSRRGTSGAACHARGGAAEVQVLARRASLPHQRRARKPAGSLTAGAADTNPA